MTQLIGADCTPLKSKSKVFFGFFTDCFCQKQTIFHFVTIQWEKKYRVSSLSVLFSPCVFAGRDPNSQLWCEQPSAEQTRTKAGQHTGLHNLITCFICRNVFLYHSAWGREPSYQTVIHSCLTALLPLIPLSVATFIVYLISRYIHSVCSWYTLLFTPGFESRDHLISDFTCLGALDFIYVETVSCWIEITKGMYSAVQLQLVVVIFKLGPSTLIHRCRINSHLLQLSRSQFTSSANVHWQCIK